MMENEIAILNADDLRSRIYMLRGEQVMMDFDLAQIYGYEVKRLNEQVSRNIKRFPEDFMFQVTKDEIEIMKSQIVTSPTSFNNLKSQFATSSWGGVRKLPFAFTEQGVYMLATVLRGEVAEQQSIFIMRAFREMKHFVQKNMQFVTRGEMQILTNTVLSIERRQNQTEEEIKKIHQSIEKINENFVQPGELKNFVIYKGQKFEADVAYTDIYRSAEHSIFVIDNYTDIKTLNLLKYKKDGVAVTLFTQNGNGKRGYLTAAEVSDFNAQYPALVIKPNPDCHDRFVITDYKTKNEKVYHCGASSKDAGNKVCAINVFENAALVYPFVDALLRQPDTIL
jgi:regulator of sigma D